MDEVIVDNLWEYFETEARLLVGISGQYIETFGQFYSLLISNIQKYTWLRLSILGVKN